jgi:hypothetical protein
MCSTFHALETTRLSSYRILNVPGRSTWSAMNGASHGGESLWWSLLLTHQRTWSAT